MQYPANQPIQKIAGLILLVMGSTFVLLTYYSLADMSFIGYLMGAVGLILLGYIYKVKIDPYRGSITLKKGFILPFVNKSFHKSDFQRVVVRKEVSQNTNNQRSPGTTSLNISFVVFLFGKEELRIESFKNSTKALECKSFIEQQLDIEPSENSILQAKAHPATNKIMIIVTLIILAAMAWAIYLAMTV